MGSGREEDEPGKGLVSGLSNWTHGRGHGTKSEIHKESETGRMMPG